MVTDDADGVLSIGRRQPTGRVRQGPCHSVGCATHESFALSAGPNPRSLTAPTTYTRCSQQHLTLPARHDHSLCGRPDHLPLLPARSAAPALAPRVHQRACPLALRVIQSACPLARCASTRAPALSRVARQPDRALRVNQIACPPRVACHPERLPSRVACQRERLPPRALRVIQSACPLAPCVPSRAPAPSRLACHPERLPPRALRVIQSA